MELEFEESTKDCAIVVKVSKEQRDFMNNYAKKMAKKQGKKINVSILVRAFIQSLQKEGNGNAKN